MSLLTSSYRTGPSYPELLSDLTSNGWTMQSEGPSGAQLKANKRMIRTQTKIALVLGVILLLAWGLGLLILVLAGIDYANTPVQTYFLSRDNPMMPRAPAHAKMSEGSKAVWIILAVLIALPVLIAIFR